MQTWKKHCPRITINRRTREQSSVEMAGIEPASKEFDQRYTTGLVYLCYLASMLPIDRSIDTSRLVLSQPLAASWLAAIRIVRRLTPTSRTKLGSNVTDLSQSMEQRLSPTRRKHIPVQKCCWHLNFAQLITRSRRPDLQSLTSRPCRSQSSPANRIIS